MRDSNAANGIIQIAGSLYCESKGADHKRNTAFMQCVFDPVRGAPWYKQRCFDKHCDHSGRWLLPLYMATVMQQAQANNSAKRDGADALSLAWLADAAEKRPCLG